MGHLPPPRPTGRNAPRARRTDSETSQRQAGDRRGDHSAAIPHSGRGGRRGGVGVGERQRDRSPQAEGCAIKGGGGALAQRGLTPAATRRPAAVPIFVRSAWADSPALRTARGVGRNGAAPAPRPPQANAGGANTRSEAPRAAYRFAILRQRCDCGLTTPSGASRQLPHWGSRDFGISSGGGSHEGEPWRMKAPATPTRPPTQRPASPV